MTEQEKNNKIKELDKQLNKKLQKLSEEYEPIRKEMQRKNINMLDGIQSIRYRELGDWYIDERNKIEQEYKKEQINGKK